MHNYINKRIQTLHSCHMGLDSINKDWTLWGHSVCLQNLKTKRSCGWCHISSCLTSSAWGGLMNEFILQSHGSYWPADQTDDWWFKPRLWVLKCRIVITGCRCCVPVIFRIGSVARSASPFAMCWPCRKTLWSAGCQTTMLHLQQWNVPVSQPAGLR